jgi:peroxiredoxin Q/BCP
MTLKEIILIVFVVWSFPFGIFRSKFRKMVYRTDSWVINIKPVFVKEIKTLFGFDTLSDGKERKLKNQYAVYLVVYIALVTLLFVL